MLNSAKTNGGGSSSYIDKCVTIMQGLQEYRRYVLDLMNFLDQPPKGNEPMDAEICHKKHSITYEESNQICCAICKLSDQSDFNLMIANVDIKEGCVLVRYYINNDSSTGSSHGISDDDVESDIKLLRDTLYNIAPRANIQLINLKKMPQFRLTAGLGSFLVHRDGSTGIKNRVGCLTALLTDADMENSSKTFTDYALTVGHNLKLGDTCQIRADDHSNMTIGSVVVKINDNGKDFKYVDAALISLETNAIDNLQLRQRFSINGVQQRLSSSEIEPPELGRVVIRAVDQAECDKGIITSTDLTIFGAPRMYNLVKIARFKEDGNHRGCLHSAGESGLLAAYEARPEVRGFVKPVVMLIGIYPEFDEHGNELYETSIGVPLHRVIDRLSVIVGQKLHLVP